MTHSQNLFLFFNLFLSPLLFPCTLVTVTFFSCIKSYYADLNFLLLWHCIRCGRRSICGGWTATGCRRSHENAGTYVHTYSSAFFHDFREEFFLKFRIILISPRGAAWKIWIAFFFTDFISLPLLSQNVLRAVKSGVVKNVLCAPGSHLKVDQIIIEFETSEKILSAAI